MIVTLLNLRKVRFCQNSVILPRSNADTKGFQIFDFNKLINNSKAVEKENVFRELKHSFSETEIQNNNYKHETPVIVKQKSIECNTNIKRNTSSSKREI